MNLNIEVIASDNNITGESPIWDAEQQRLIWSDIDGGFVYQYRPSDGSKQTISIGINISGIALNKRGGFIVGRSDGLFHWTVGRDFRPIATEHEGNILTINDILTDHSGRIYAGTLYWGENGMEGLGKLYLIGPDGSIKIVDDGIELANGLALSPDGDTLYFADSAARKIYAYDVNKLSGDLSAKRVFVSVPTNEGIPDGITVDSEGFVWCAQWYGGRIVRYDPNGNIERNIEMPVLQVSSLAFGGLDLESLYVTTAGGSWPSPLAPSGYDFEDSNIGGSLYRIRMDMQGKLENLAAFDSSDFND